MRRRVQQETLGHRGHKDDPLYRSCRLLTKGHERVDEKGEAKLLTFLEAGDPNGEVRRAWHAKETLSGLYDQPPEDAPGYLAELVDSLLDADMPGELRQLGRTVRRWSAQIVAWHRAQVTNGPTEAMNSLIKRIKRVSGFGFRRFRRLRVLFYAGAPNWDRLATLTPITPSGSPKRRQGTRPPPTTSHDHDPATAEPHDDPTGIDEFAYEQRIRRHLDAPPVPFVACGVRRMQ